MVLYTTEDVTVDDDLYERQLFGVSTVAFQSISYSWGASTQYIISNSKYPFSLA